jgi:hypothetical protein
MLRLNKSIRLTGGSLVGVSGVGLFLWVASGDDDCYYTTDVFLQLRLCDGYIEKLTAPPSYDLLVILLVIMFLGVFLIHISRESN